MDIIIIFSPIIFVFKIYLVGHKCDKDNVCFPLSIFNFASCMTQMQNITATRSIQSVVCATRMSRAYNTLTAGGQRAPQRDKSLKDHPLYVNNTIHVLALIGYLRSISSTFGRLTGSPQEVEEVEARKKPSESHLVDLRNVSRQNCMGFSQRTTLALRCTNAWRSRKSLL